MDERREMRSRERAEAEAEAQRIRAALDEERALLEAVKQLKLRELAAAGVDKKYHAQLERLAVGRPAAIGK